MKAVTGVPIPLVPVLLLLCLVGGLYVPGLSGSFYLDDYPNLAALSQVSAPGGYRYAIFQQLASPLGRPLANLSFVLQAVHWPEHPLPFKLVNLCIHLFNTLLVLLISQRLTLYVHPAWSGRRRVWWLALGVALFWATAPIQVSTVMYVIQRMNLLAGSFVLLGVLAWFSARSQLGQGNLRRAGLSFAGVGACLLLGVLSKENAILLPVFILALEHTVLRKGIRPAGLRRWMAVFLWLPLAAAFGYLLYRNGFANAWLHRDFTPGQRLLTEPRVLFDYWWTVLQPSTDRLGLFHDNFPLSHSLLQPLSTLPALLAVITLLCAAILLRKRRPVLALAVFWYFGGHALESTALPLEIYFEHRNYIPLFGPVWAVAIGLTGLLQRMPARRMKFAVLATLALLLVNDALTTWKENTLWGDPGRLALAKLKAFPDSPRARDSAVDFLIRIGEFQPAAVVLTDGRANAARQPDILGKLLYLRCFARLTQLPQRSEILSLLRDTAFDNGLVAALAKINTEIELGHCTHLDKDLYTAVYRQLLDNPNYSRAKASLTLHFSRLLALTGELQRASAMLETVIDEPPQLEPLMQLLDWQITLRQLPGAHATLQAATRVLQASGTLQRLQYSGRLAYYRGRLPPAQTRPPPAVK